MNYKDIQGWFDFGPLYDRIVSEAPENSTLVEVGCWKGRSTCYLADRIKKSGKHLILYAVDTWKGSPEDREYISSLGYYGLYRMFLSHMAKSNVLDVIVPIISSSTWATLEFNLDSIFFVYLDADHNYHGIASDIDLWLPKVQIGGYIGGHDYNDNCGVKRAVDERFSRIENIYSSWLYRKQNEDFIL